MQRIALPVPPLELQQRFASRIDLIAAHKIKTQRSEQALDQLFHSLQNRAFNGDLWPNAIAALISPSLPPNSPPSTTPPSAHPTPSIPTPAPPASTRRALEIAVSRAFKHDPALRLPYQDNLSALIHEPTFRAVAGEAVVVKAQLITRLGNQAVHSHAAIQPADALTAVRELFHVAYWLARTYSRAARPAAALVFNPLLLPRTAPLPPQTVEQLQTLEAGLRERDEKLAAVLADRNALDAELKSLRAEVAEARRAAESRPDTHDYSEAETRDTFIDLLLREAGWPLTDARDREFPVTGVSESQTKGFVDYVLWGSDGKPLAVIEAKRTKRDPRAGQQQAKLYADCLERQFDQRPVIIYTNGYEHWLWDDSRYPPRSVQGFFKKAELELIVQRRSTRLSLAGASIDPAIVGRAYQTRAIRRLGEAFERNNDRRALLVMAPARARHAPSSRCAIF